MKKPTHKFTELENGSRSADAAMGPTRGTDQYDERTHRHRCGAEICQGRRHPLCTDQGIANVGNPAPIHQDRSPGDHDS
jgi:hypothetical protein